jgi:hypothetical protein
MDWQIGIVSLIVAVAGGYLARQTWRSWFGAKAGCGGGCGCSTQKGTAPAEGRLVPPEQLTLRRRPTNG